MHTILLGRRFCRGDGVMGKGGLDLGEAESGGVCGLGRGADEVLERLDHWFVLIACGAQVRGQVGGLLMPYHHEVR